MSTNLRYELRCRECQTRWGNQPISFCQNCFAPLEVAYDWDRIRKEINKDEIARRPTNLWRYKELLPKKGEGSRDGKVTQINFTVPAGVTTGVQPVVVMVGDVVSPAAKLTIQ